MDLREGGRCARIGIEDLKKPGQRGEIDFGRAGRGLAGRGIAGACGDRNLNGRTVIAVRPFCFLCA